MAILGISSSTRTISVAIAENGKLIAEQTISGKQAFTEDIALYVEKLVSESGAKIESVAITVGPGGYSGIRGGMAFAKTLAQVRGLKLTGVSTLLAIAYNLRDINGTIAVATDACQDDYNFALFRPNNGMIERLTDDAVIPIDRLIGLLSKVRGELYLIGYNEELISPIRSTNPGTRILFGHNFIASGYAVALAGEQMIKEGKIEDPLKLMPKYSHMPKIRTWDKSESPNVRKS
jgi:tRNA threonylcarbamoyladenosine biosynthesis protein TsaB